MQQRIRCPNCGSPNAPGQKFCGSCGASIGSSACPNCGASLDPGARFCGNCGAQLPGIGTQQENFSPPQQQQWSQPPQRQWEQSGGMAYAGRGDYGTPARRQSTMPLVILLIVLIIGLGGFAYWAFLGNTSWSSDGSGLQITNGPFINALSDNTTATRDVTITWETNTQAVGRVEYGASTSYGSSSEFETSFVTSHSVKLSNLEPDTRFHYRVIIKDKKDKEVKSGDFTFKTPQ